MKRLITGLAAVALLASACGGAADQEPEQPTVTVTVDAAEPEAAVEPEPEPVVLYTRFDVALRECRAPWGITEDGGTTLALNPNGINSRGGYYIRGNVNEETFECLIDELAPSHIATRVGSTRAIDGTQTGTWDGIEAHWSYDPDTQVTLVMVDQAAQDDPGFDWESRKILDQFWSDWRELAEPGGDRSTVETYVNSCREFRDSQRRDGHGGTAPAEWAETISEASGVEVTPELVERSMDIECYGDPQFMEP